MGDPGRDERLREAAANCGLKLVKSLVRTPGRGDYGRYGLTDFDGARLLGFGRSGLTATAEEIEDYLHKGGLADWKTSLRAAGAKASPQPKKRPAADPAPNAVRTKPPEPEPEPKPPSLSVRPARPADSEIIAALLAGLGFEAAPGDIKGRLAALRTARETPLVADRGE